MTFSYSLFAALILLFPGLCFWAGWQIGDQSDFATPAPERPNSTSTLFAIVLGTLVGHFVGATYFFVQSLWCTYVGLCHPVEFDLNIYKAIANGEHAKSAGDFAFVAWSATILFISTASGAVAFFLSRTKWITDRIDPFNFGWLNPAVIAVKSGDAFVIAYVLTKTSNDGYTVAYEGIVQHLALNDQRGIDRIILSQVDRFLVKVGRFGVFRMDVAADVIEQLYISVDEISNIAFETIRHQPDAKPTTVKR